MSALWSLEPRDTFIAGDGRPITDASLPVRSLDVPWPSTIAGFVRTRIGTGASGVFQGDPAKLRQVAVRGPWLAAMSEGAAPALLVPAPADCVVWQDEDEDAKRAGLRRLRLAPVPIPNGCVTDLDGLSVVGFLKESPRGKPAADAPRYWRWSELEAWLAQPADDTALPRGFGHGRPVHERRIHVAIDPATQTAADGNLYVTDGVRLATKDERLAIFFECGERMSEGLVCFGGERRLASLRPVRGGTVLPELPSHVLEEVVRSRLARLVLLTPGLFDAGFAPGVVGLGEGARLHAAAVGRPEAVSGWDLERGGPKPARRMAPAGSVYWVELAAGTDARAWVQERWFRSIADREQDRRDGFGIVAVGVA